MWAQVGTLIMATSLIQLANGFFGAFISLRVAIEDFGATMSGLVLSSYFAGSTLGALRCERIIGASSGISAPMPLSQGWSCAATALMPLRVGPLPWLTLARPSASVARDSLSPPRAGSTLRLSPR